MWPLADWLPSADISSYQLRLFSSRYRFHASTLHEQSLSCHGEQNIHIEKGFEMIQNSTTIPGRISHKAFFWRTIKSSLCFVNHFKQDFLKPGIHISSI